MKNIVIMLAILLTGSMALIAQDVIVPSDWQDLYDNYGLFFATYLGVAGVATFLAEYVIRLFKITGRVGKIIFVILIAIGLSFLANAINIGYLAEAAWYEVLLWGALSAVAAAGLRGTNLLFAKTVVDFVIGLIAEKE